jgi:hypothetical protein
MFANDWTYSRSPFERLLKTVVCKKNRPQIKKKSWAAFCGIRFLAYFHATKS